MKVKKKILVVVLGACLLLALLPLMAVTAWADGPHTGGTGDELTDDTTVTATIQASIITTISSSYDFGSIPAGTATARTGAIDANVRSNVVYSMDVHALGNFIKGLDTMGITALAIKGGALLTYTTMTLTSRGIHILVDEPVPETDAGTDYAFDLQLTPPSETPAGADYTTTLQFTTYQ
ncbi:MAG: hypothetical protein M1337_07270 [Actinobacteria bacterium]|nr:hypothetical protein [Actinomycetota bacterium]